MPHKGSEIMKFYSVITTIAEPTECVLSLVERIKSFSGRLVVAGDRKGPVKFDAQCSDFLSIDTQQDLNSLTRNTYYFNSVLIYFQNYRCYYFITIQIAILGFKYNNYFYKPIRNMLKQLLR